MVVEDILELANILDIYCIVIWEYFEILDTIILWFGIDVFFYKLSNLDMALKKMPRHTDRIYFIHLQLSVIILLICGAARSLCRWGVSIQENPWVFLWRDLNVRLYMCFHCTVPHSVCGQCSLQHFPSPACMFCMCLHYGLCYWRQGFQVDTVTVPRRATVGPCHPTTEALSLCSSWLVMDFLLPLSLFSLTFAPFFSEPIFLSEVLIWGAGQWGEGTEWGDRGRVGWEVGGGTRGAEWWWLQTDGPLFLLSQAPLLSLRGSSCVGAFQWESEREREALEEKGGTMICPTGIFKYHMHTHASDVLTEKMRAAGRKEQINQKMKKQEGIGQKKIEYKGWQRMYKDDMKKTPVAAVARCKLHILTARWLYHWCHMWATHS